MVLKVLSLPKGILDIFAIGEMVVTRIDDSSEHRPDLILKDNTIYDEMVNNYMSCASPISCKKGKEYLLMTEHFKGSFKR